MREAAASDAYASDVPWRIRLAYAAPSLALAIVGIPIYVYVPKLYSDVAHVDLALLGSLMLAVRIFDAVIDPVVGVLSDRTRSTFGRRRPWIALGAIPLAVAVAFLLNPPGAGGPNPAVWFGLSLLAVFIFWTCVTIPYESLGPEITFDHDARTSLLGLREGALLIGTIVAALTPPALASLLHLPPGEAGDRATFTWMTVLYAPLLVLACGWCVAAIHEPAPRRSATVAPERLSLGEALHAIRSNRPFAILIASYTVSALGSSLPGTLILFYVQYVLQAEGAELFLLIYLVSGVVFLFAWVSLSHRIGKKAAWLASMALNAGAFIGVFFLGPGDTLAYGVLVFLSGAGFGGVIAIAASMQADVIDFDEYLSGRRREGLYIGVWTVARKLAAALGVGLALPILDASGYVPNAEQKPEVILTLRTLYAFVPGLCAAGAIAIALAYPLTREKHHEILRALGRAPEKTAA